MQFENIAQNVADGSEMLHVLERKINAVVGIFTKNAHIHCKKPGQDFGFNMDCPDNKHAWFFNPGIGPNRGDVRLWTLDDDESKNLADIVYEQGRGMAPQNVELTYDLLDHFVQGMLKAFPELEEKVLPYIKAAKRKEANGIIE